MKRCVVLRIFGRLSREKYFPMFLETFQFATSPRRNLSSVSHHDETFLNKINYKLGALNFKMTSDFVEIFFCKVVTDKSQQLRENSKVSVPLFFWNHCVTKGRSY